MDYWPWWVSGLALSGVMVLHWFALHRMMAVSGRVTALVDRLRDGAPEPAPTLSPEEMMAAIQAVTAAEFGEEHASSFQGAGDKAPGQVAPSLAPRRTPTEHLLFFVGLTSGGALAAATTSGFSPTLWLRGAGFQDLSGGAPLSSVALLGLGGLLVGFGTRMSGGCTSGHGLCGVSRLQPGSLLATLSFFGMGIVVSFGLSVLL